MRRIFLTTATVWLALSFAVGSAGDAGTLKGDYKAFLSPEGIWSKDSGKKLIELRFEGKDFPKLQLKMSAFVPATKDVREDPSSAVSVSAILTEKDGKNVLVIEGKNIAYSFEGKGEFLVLKGEFEYKKKNVSLTGKWGVVQTKK
jgi:hypothetical protein